ncbi:uncharacterized protein L969DRAFT_86324 [Mixia osmundae IAM 14324]|uniref:Cation efflux protein transmembrane domain-containing protein n=1 Tax=Mixia osmundae (strain CBS 9802 / IAM 14324 / JCM 22182 / KY 12970) TaxID=764103 RepID=G7DUE5_MIXOS|nr:uncharacterized protein L969DRAFT_86324 [Mixia osmundae IAM 14324]KEI41077.1 hypothetical protein L969DRAFT_86324 [Mixia osmundae IAM 14324]GAA94205.1 hypothetical protein E5Q_00853 [Mixia osmundae IAM 14324]
MASKRRQSTLQYGLHKVPQSFQNLASMLQLGDNVDDTNDIEDGASQRTRDESLERQHQRRPIKQSQSLFHIAGLVDNSGGRFERYRMSDDELKTIKKKKIREFYEKQNEILDYFAEVDEVLDATHASALAPQEPQAAGSPFSESSPLLPVAREDYRSSRAREGDKLQEDVKWAIAVNLIINVILLLGKIVVALLSNSISLVASLVDSAMDLLSTVIIWVASRAMSQKDWKSQYQWPVGKRRMEPLGVVVFSVFMIASFAQVFIESLQRLANPGELAVNIPFPGICVMVGTIVVKGGVWLYYHRVNNTSVKALAQDAENDMVFNFFSIAFPYIGQLLGLPWLDAAGGLLLSVYIILEWSETLFSNLFKLTGRRAGPAQHQRMIYLATRFSPLIKGVQYSSVFYQGDRLVVETDVVVPPDTPLPLSHDVAEAAQYAIESLEDVERAYVHVDFSTTSPSGHAER